MEVVTDFLFLGSKITTDSDCSHEIRRRLFLVRKAMTNLGSVLKSRDTTLPTKVHIVKAMLVPVVLYDCGDWTVKKAEGQKIDAFFMVQLSQPYVTTGKITALTTLTFVGRVVSLLFNTLSRSN